MYSSHHPPPPISKIGTTSASQGTADTTEEKTLEADKKQLTSPPSPLEILRNPEEQQLIMYCTSALWTPASWMRRWNKYVQLTAFYQSFLSLQIRNLSVVLKQTHAGFWASADLIAPACSNQTLCISTAHGN